MTKGKIGRPRSEKAREAVVQAAHDLLTEEGAAGLSIEAVAKRAGVGRPTIYRWWPSAADIALEAVLRRADADIPVPAVEPLEEALGLFLRRSMRALDWGGPHLRFLMAQAQKDAAFGERFREGFVARRRAVMLSLLQRAGESGRRSSGIGLDLAVDMVFGAMWYRLLTGHAPLDAAFADDLTEAAMRLVQEDHAPSDVP